MWDSGETKRSDDSESGERSFAAHGHAAHHPDRNQRVDHQAEENRRQEPTAKIDWRRDRKRALAHGKGPITGTGQHLAGGQGIDGP